jgi:putative mycofactocin binding protein MftB
VPVPARPGSPRPGSPRAADRAGLQFDLDGAWRLNSNLSVRPERFGALLYHFDTRRLSFLKNKTLLAVVASLESQRSARAACTAAGVTAAELPASASALAALAASAMICERTGR